MTAATNPTLGHIACPTCGNKSATVHREKQGKRALYLRCYGSDHWCGTLQCRGPGGQQYIERNARWLDMEGQDEAKREAAEEAGENAAEEVRTERKRRSIFGKLADIATTDEV